VRRKITQRNIAVMCGCSEVYVSRVLNNPKNYNTETAKLIKRFAYDHFESIISDPLFMALIRKYRPKSQEEEDTLDEWKYTAKLFGNKKRELDKIR